MVEPVTVEAILDGLIAVEGGYVDHPADRGGPTKFGITLETLRAWRGDVSLSAEDVAALTEREARTIYRVQYVDGPGFGAVRDDRLRALLVDFAVHSGPRRAVQALQRALGVVVDGRCGPVTVAALERADLGQVYRIVLQSRALYLADVLQADPAQRVFAAGWLRRLAGWL